MAKLCRCGVRELEEGETLCPACVEARGHKLKRAIVGVGSVALSLALFVVTRGKVKLRF